MCWCSSIACSAVVAASGTRAFLIPGCTRDGSIPLSTTSSPVSLCLAKWISVPVVSDVCRWSVGR